MKKLFIITGFCLMLGAVFMPAQAVLAEEITEQPAVKTGHITDPEFRGLAWEMMGSIVDSRIELYAAWYDIDWSVSKKSIKTTPYFYRGRLAGVGIDITTSATACGGIIDYYGNVSYVEGTKLKYTFAVEKATYYCVFVKNNNSFKITAKGQYAK